MAESVDVVIIGGGIAGASTAYFLAREGAGNIVVLERGTVAAGASSRASGLVAFIASGHPGMADVLKASSDFYAAWDEEVGRPTAINRVGGLALAGEERREALEHEVTAMRDAGHDVSILNRADLDARLSGWNLEGIDLAAFNPASGYIDPPMVTTALMNRARALGVRVYSGAEVTGIELQGGKAAGVQSTRGEIRAPLVILAAGAWSAPLARLVGVDLPIWAVRHQVMHLVPPEDVTWPFPGTVDPYNSLYFRPEAGGLILAANSGPDEYPDEPTGHPETFDPSVSPWYAEWIMRHLARRIPAMAGAEIAGGHSGAYPKGPDDLPVIGPIAEGLYCICDTSGSGMTTSPGLARALVETIMHGSTYTDTRPFQPSRFREPAAAGAGWKGAGRPSVLPPGFWES